MFRLVYWNYKRNTNTRKGWFIMKNGTIVVLAFVLIAGGLTVSYAKDETSVTVQLTMDDTEKAAQAAGQIVRGITDSIRQAQDDEASEIAAPEAEIVTEQVFYRVRDAACDPDSQIGAYNSFDIAKSVCTEGFCVFDQNDHLICTADSAS